MADTVQRSWSPGLAAGSVPAARRQGLHRLMRRRSTTAFLMCLPLILIITCLVAYPAAYSIYLSMLNKARLLFRKGTQWPPGVGGQPKLVPDNEVHHFVDTLANPDIFLFDYNKGELQYTYLLFENNGNPIVENAVGPSPQPPTNLAVQ